MPIVILTAGQWLPLAVILPSSTGAQGTSVCLSACVCVCTSSIFPRVLLSGPAQLLFFFLSSPPSCCSLTGIDFHQVFLIYCHYLGFTAPHPSKLCHLSSKVTWMLGNHRDNQTNSGTGVKVSPVSEDRKVLMHQFKETLEN